MAGKTTNRVQNPTKIKDQIIAWISDGKTLREYCRQKGKPCYRTVYTMLEKDEDFSARFARARDLGHDVLADECLQIADSICIGEETTDNLNGRSVIRKDQILHRKLQIETRLKLLAKWNPKKYGDKLTTEHTGEDGGPIKYADETKRESRFMDLLAVIQQRKQLDQPE